MILFIHLQRAVEALQRPISPHLLEAIMSLDNTRILALIFSTKKVGSWLYQQAVDELFPEQQQVIPQREVSVREHPSSPVLQVQRLEPSVVTVPSTDKEKSKGKRNANNA